MNNPKVAREAGSKQGSSASNSWFNRKRVFQLGALIGLLAGSSAVLGGGWMYLSVTKNTLAVRDGRLAFSEVNSTDINSVNDESTVVSEDSIDAGGDSVVIDGDASSVSNDSYADGVNSPLITGDNNVVNISNQELPGFDAEKGYTLSPPDLARYSKASDLQPDSFLRDSSDHRMIDFERNEVTIGGKIYTSYFLVSPYAEASRFVFRLEGSQEAALFQFGLPDLVSGNETSDTYTVRILVDGELLWAGECKRSQGSQLVSVPLDMPGAESLVIEVTSNSGSNDPLHFITAQLLN